MGSKSYNPSTFYHIADGTETLKKHAHDIATQQLIPRIVQRNRTAVETVKNKLFYFQALRGAGRRCSCWDIETSASNHCTACWGTGTVGGYNKYGAALEVIDVTRPNIRSSNIIPDYSIRYTPQRFALIDGAKYGSIETRLTIGPNIGEVDVVSAFYALSAGNALTAYIRSPADEEYVALTTENLKIRLSNNWIDVKIEFERVSTLEKSPYLDAVHLRWKTKENQTVLANLPREQHSNALAEYGIYEDFSELNFWMDDKLKSITTDDFFVTEINNSRFKAVSVKPFAPEGILTSWDISVRYVQNHEAYYSVPLSNNL